MQIRNNYDMLWQSTDTGEVGTGIYNGDTGTIVALDPAARVLTVRFDDREAEYPFEQLGELEHAYAVTAHKSQGSEYEAVIIPVYAAPERLLSRNLLYTAVTRAKRLLVLVGREEMVRQMIDTPNRNRRYCGLKTRVRELCQ
jgi:exodeoxyribonuclease V alpha subunit